MIITDYYKFEKNSLKSKSRMDCTASTGSYPLLEQLRATKAIRATEKKDATEVGDLVIYLGKNINIKSHDKRSSGLAIGGKSGSISSIYFPATEDLSIGYGDFKGSTDALLFSLTNIEIVDGLIAKDAILEVFIARGRKNDCMPLFTLFAEGELDEEITELRSKALLKKKE